jgi:hypothetical protein
MDSIALPLAHILAFLACLACVTYTSLVLIRLLDIPWNVSRFLALAVLNCAQIVLVVEILSLLESIRARNLMLIHCGVAAILLALKCRPAPLWPYAPRAFLRKIIESSDKPLQALLAVTVLAGGTTFFLALYVPPNNHDSMTYHLARVGYYMQQGSLKSYPTANIRQTILPANAEILMLWQVSLLRMDTAVALVQWLSWLGSVLAIYGIARQLRAPPKGALFAALAFASFPQIVLQSTSTQNDLVTAFFLLCAFLFVAELPKPQAASGLLAGISLGLAIGTKTSALIMLPGFGIYVLACLVSQKEFTLRRVLGLLLISSAAILALGSYFYFQNFFNYGSPTGPASFTGRHVLDRFEWQASWSNFGRLLTQFLNPSGIIPPLDSIHQSVGRNYSGFTDSILGYLGISKHLPGKDFSNASGTDYAVLTMHEDLTFFGPVFGYLGLATLFYQLLRRDYRRATLRLRAIALAAIVFWLVVAVALRWQVWSGRLMVPMVAIGSPLLASLYSERKRLWPWIWNTLLVAVCISCLLSAVLLNEMKPVIGPRTIWGKDRIQLMTLSRQESAVMFRFIDSLGLKGKRLGVVQHTADFFEYPLFGRSFERRIIPIRIDREELLTLENLPEVSFLLMVGEEQAFFRVDRSTKPAGGWVGTTNLQPLIDALRNPNSEWRPFLDVDGFMHLFAKKQEYLDLSAFSVFPDVLLGPWNIWPDYWVQDDFIVHARINPATPILEIRGETPDLGVRPQIKIEGPKNTTLSTIVLGRSGPFSSRVSMASLLPDYLGKYAALRFRSNMRFNLKKLGQSDDPRDLSWRLFELKISSDTPAPTDTTENNPADYDLLSTWWSDRWVGGDFRIKIRIHPSTPILQVSGEVPGSPVKFELRVMASGQLLKRFDIDAPGLFTQQISLAPLVPQLAGKYAILEFVSNYSFNPKKLKISSDYRDLSWRLYDLKLMPK